MENLCRKKMYHLSTATLFCVASIIIATNSVSAYNGKQLNAIAVSAVWMNCGWEEPNPKCGWGDSYMDGPLVKYLIRNGVVTRADTIYKATLGLAEYPAFNIAGTKIAFYRESRAQAATGNSCAVVNGGKSYISIINSDGSGLTNLCELPNIPVAGESMPLDWPAGDWIYYVRPRSPSEASATGSSSNITNLRIWKVNVLTSATSEVCSPTDPGNSKGTTDCAFWRRFTMSADGTRACGQIMPEVSCSPTTSYDGNSVWAFPFTNCQLGSTLGSRPGCNISLSPSGTIMGSYYAGNHDNLFINGVGNSYAFNVTLDSLAVWSGKQVGTGAELIRFSANSDKWVMQDIGMNPGDGHAGQLQLGSNQVLCSWVDRVAINISNHGQFPAGSTNTFTRINNCAGDLWVNDPTGNANRNSYEDIQGAWHAVSGAPSIPSDASNPWDFTIASAKGDTLLGSSTGTALQNIVHSTPGFRVHAAQRELTISLPSHAPATVRLIDIRGSIVKHVQTSGQTVIVLNGLAAGTYFTIINNTKGLYATRIILK